MPPPVGFMCSCVGNQGAINNKDLKIYVLPSNLWNLRYFHRDFVPRMEVWQSRHRQVQTLEAILDISARNFPRLFSMKCRLIHASARSCAFFCLNEPYQPEFNSFTELHQTKSLVILRVPDFQWLKTSISQLSEVEDFFPAPMRPLQLSSTWPAATNASDPPTQRCGWSSRRAVLLRAKIYTACGWACFVAKM